tara:strand:- start:776 stop:1273 length:498 start_codon:yes stop_codon:yes gene_type:complete
MFLELKKFKEIVQNAPLIAIDIFIIKNGKLLLGRRKNAPGKNLFFVPGGRIMKNETINQAFVRILNKETNFILKNKSISSFFIGLDEHFYEDNFLDNNEFNTHYIVLLFLLKFDDLESTNNKINLEEQHHEHLWFDNKRDIEIIENMNIYMKGYLKRPEIKKLIN